MSQLPPPPPPYSPVPKVALPWHRTTWFTVLTLVLFFPLGLYLMWLKQPTWATVTKVIVSVALAGVLIPIVVVAAVTTPKTPTAIPFVLASPTPSSTGTPTTSASTTPTAALTPPPTAVATAPPVATPAPTAVPIFPPMSAADLHALAAKGDASAIHEFHSESVGVGTCPQPKRSVTVDPSVTGQQLAQDLLAYYYAQGLDNPCGSLVLAYHSADEAGNAYTAGRINVDVTDATGAPNIDPNGSNLKYTLTLDAGQEYTVKY